jgi:hypothetical protein
VIQNPETGAEEIHVEKFNLKSVPMSFLSEFVWVDVPKLSNSAYETAARRHMWSTLEILGYDLRLTSHSMRGDKVGVSRNGTDFLRDCIPFGQVANRNRQSKLVSTIERHILIDNPITEFSAKIDLNGIQKGTCTQLNVMYVTSNRFGKNAGIEPADDTQRTRKGTQALLSSRTNWRVVTEEEYAEFLESYASNSTIIELVELKARYVPVNDNLEEKQWFLPENVVALTKQYKKLVYGVRGGSVCTHTEEDYIATYHPVNSFEELTGENSKVVHIIDSANALIKKGAFNITLEVAYSQLSLLGRQKLDSIAHYNNLSSTELICNDRSEAAFRATKGGAKVQVGQFNDYVGLLEQALIAEGKLPTGEMFIYELSEDNVLTPVMDQDGNHYKCMVGAVTTFQANYDGEQGSYNIISTDGVSMDPHIRTMCGVGIKLNETELDLWDTAQANILSFSTPNHTSTDPAHICWIGNKPDQHKDSKRSLLWAQLRARRAQKVQAQKDADFIKTLVESLNETITKDMINFTVSSDKDIAAENEALKQALKLQAIEEHRSKKTAETTV